MFLRQGKEWCVQLQLLEPRKAAKHWSVCAPHIPSRFKVMETELPPAPGMCCRLVHGVQPVGCPTGVAAASFDSWSSVVLWSTPWPWVLLTTVASQFQGSALNPFGSVGRFPFLVVGSEGGSTENRLCNTCSRHHQELSSNSGPCLIAWCVMEQNNSSPGNSLEAAAEAKTVFSVICVCDKQGTLGTCPDIS